MQQRLPIVLSAGAVIVAVFGTTPLGQAAGHAVTAVVPPFAKTAGYARFAGDSTKLNGRKSTLAGAAGTIPVVGANGKLPASLGTVGPQGAKGDKGDKGDRGATGAAGPAGLAGVHVVEATATRSTPTTLEFVTASCPTGETVLGGGGLIQQYNASGFVGLIPLAASTPSGNSWFTEMASSSVAGSVVLHAYAVCAKTNSTT